MTARLEDVSVELSDLAARRIQAGEWPWTFFCLPEERPRPVFPSSFFLLSASDEAVGIAVRCPVCTRTSVNLVTHNHVDLPFHNDAEIGVVRHVFWDEPVEDGFGSLLASSEIDGRRLELQAPARDGAAESAAPIPEAWTPQSRRALPGGRSSSWSTAPHSTPSPVTRRRPSASSGLSVATSRGCSSARSPRAAAAGATGPPRGSAGGEGRPRGSG